MPPSTETAYLNRVADVESLLQENYKGEVVPYLDIISPVHALFEPLDPGEYSLEGRVLTFAGDYTYAGGAMYTQGHLPASQYVDPVLLQTIAARCYVRRMVDNFIVARGTGEATFEDFMTRIMRQMWEAFERTGVRSVHGSSRGILNMVMGGTPDEPIVHNGYGYEPVPGAGGGPEPTMFIEPGMWVAALNPADSFAVRGVATVMDLDRHNDGTATLRLVNRDPGLTGIPGLTTGDVLTFATSDNVADDWFEVEYGLAILGLLDLIDPQAEATAYLGAEVSYYPRLNPIRVESADWGEVEFMEFTEEIASRSNSPVTPETHTFTCQPGVKIELAKTLIPFTRIEQKGKELEGGWTAVRIAMQDFITDPYHIPDVLYAISMEDAYNVPLDGDPRIWEGDGSQFQRLINFDGKQWWARYYSQRFLNRRNRCGALTNIANPNQYRFVPVPAGTSS